MTDKPILLIYNPRAGTGAIGQKLTEIFTTFTKAGYRLEVHPTTCRGDAKECAGKAGDQYAMIIAAGGDGTMNEVVSGVAESGADLPLGYLPVGSTNDFAASLGLPSDPVRAAEMILTGGEHRIDVGLMNGRTFNYVAAFGAFTKVSYATDQNLKNVFGHAAYILSGIKEVADIRPYRMRITRDGVTKEAGYLLGMITNSVSVGGFRTITGKDVALSDGLFEVTLIREPRSLSDLQEIILVLLGLKETSALVETGKAGEIICECSEEIPWTLDGEYGGDAKKVTIRNRSRALRMIY